MALDKYHTLMTVVDTGSLTRASEQLGCTQSAVSHCLDALETELGFTVLPSCSNFIFTVSDRIASRALYTKLKERGVLIRRFDKAGIENWSRITIGTREQMDILLKNIREILEELP